MKLNRRELYAALASAAGAGCAHSSRPQESSRGVESSWNAHTLPHLVFPIGGIGTGTISLRGNGSFADLQIGDRPGLGKRPPGMFSMARLRFGQSLPLLRVLSAPPLPAGLHGFCGPCGDGLPRFAASRWRSEYPVAQIDLRDDALPVSVGIEAWNPCVPLSVADSSVPVAFFSYQVTNHGAHDLHIDLAVSLANFLGYDFLGPIPDGRSPALGNNWARPWHGNKPSEHGIIFGTDKCSGEQTCVGGLALAVLEGGKDARIVHRPVPNWDQRSAEFLAFVDTFVRTGASESSGDGIGPTPAGQSHESTLIVSRTINAGSTASITFALAWYFPNRHNDWSNDKRLRGAPFRNAYANRFENVEAVIRHAASEREAWRTATFAFRRALWQTTVPLPLVDAASSQLAVLRSQTCFLTEPGGLYAFEGSGPEAGTYPLNTTHVWNYVSSVAALFPDLERGMRRLDFKENLFADGSMAFRSLLPAGIDKWSWYAACDGQLGAIVRLWREYRHCGDEDFLRLLWPGAKLALEYALSVWDLNGDGVIEGEQHNTYDTELYGPNPFTGALYLSALQAGAHCARAMNEPSLAVRYEGLIVKGKAAYEALFNGEYYEQHVPPLDEIRSGRAGGANKGEPLRVVDSNHQQLRHQLGAGCLSDQLLGAWMARLAGLSPPLDQGRMRAALVAIHKYNFRKRWDTHVIADRRFVEADEAGLVNASWPRGRRPRTPILYADETWTGVEYQVAGLMLEHGLLNEGTQIVAATRQRHDGRRRSPYDDEEAGHHYVRAMSSWSLLSLAAGFDWNALTRTLTFDPRFSVDAFESFFATDEAWGCYRQSRKDARAEIEILYGRLRMNNLRVNLSAAPKNLSIVTKGQTRTVGLQSQVVNGVSTRLINLALAAGPQTEFGPGTRLRFDSAAP